jgi:hypothetical protein
LWLLLAAVLACAGGCEWIQRDLTTINRTLSDGLGGPDLPSGTEHEDVPAPLHLLLPHEIRIHPFTGTRTFDEAGGVRGLDVRVEAKDAYDDLTKAFGRFFFELYEFRTDSPDPKGERLATWEEDLLDPRDNLRHWGGMVARRYHFRLQWDQPIPVGRKFVLTVAFTSPWTDRLSDEHVFVSGQ